MVLIMAAAAASTAAAALKNNDMQRDLCTAIIRRVLSSGLSQRPSSSALLAHASKETHTYRAKCTRQAGVRRSEAPKTGKHPSAARRERCCPDFAERLTVCGSTNRSEQVMAPSGIEVEVKLRLPDRAAYDKAALLFGGSNTQAVYAQENFFFDGSKQELSSKKTILRLRFYNTDEKAVFTIKGKQILENGIARATEVEEDTESVSARRFLTHPDEALAASPLIASTASTQGITSLVCLGGFENQRRVYAWQQETIELDETKFEWGTLYEIECETDHPEQLRDKLEGVLRDNDISFEYSATSKFANFKNKTLL